MRLSFNSIRNLRDCTFLLVRARLSILQILPMKKEKKRRHSKKEKRKEKSSPIVYSQFASLIFLSFSYCPFQHFQRDIVRGVEGFIVTGSKQVEIGRLVKPCCPFLNMLVWFLACQVLKIRTFLSGSKLSEDSRKYGVENTCTSGSTLSKAALNYGRARGQMEKERGTLLKALGTQV